VAIAVADVRSVARNEISAGRTSLAILGGVLLMAGVLFSALVIGFASNKGD
jgi:hypothetical protein